MTTLQDQEQLSANLDTAVRAAINARLLNVHTCMPAIIDMFDAATQTATVQPAIKRVFRDHEPLPLPICVDVPVCFPGGGDYAITFPVKHGDECLLIFGERCIDNWHSDGGVQLPAEYRTHDLSDAFALVGVNSQPRIYSNLNTTGAEFRTRDAATLITVGDDGSITQRTAGGSITLSSAGALNIQAPGGVTINAGALLDVTATTSRFSGLVVANIFQSIATAFSDLAQKMQQLMADYNTHTHHVGTTPTTPPDSGGVA